MSNYAAKRAIRLVSSLTELGDAMKSVTPDTETKDVKPTIVELAQELQSTTNFTDFILAGHESTFLFDGVIFGYIVEQREAGEIRFFKVLHSEKVGLSVGFMITSSEVAHHAELGKKYSPRMNVADMATEKVRTIFINTLLAAVDADGGHEAVMAAIELKRHQERREKVLEGRAEKIRRDINNGTLETDPLKMFDDTEVRTFGFIVDDKPVVIRTGSLPVDKNGEYYAHAALVLSAPRGGCKQDSYVELSKLFEEKHPHPFVCSLVKFLLAVFDENQLPEARRLSKLLVGEVTSTKEVALPVEVPFGQFTVTSTSEMKH